ncbi:glutamine amidotransferase [Aquincola sp. S2]|uniref:Glutamine amidotransferase n=1 Tax=Pseudaquabacterium terrae TaxID=2732868 RepID=A0ABX2EHW6_9BURK|nr:type 1 glutamine amidotransferase family protein [Aquabacterium terrae]NRF68211.1 glutamine amidotransferase [Aquabacterium terrae]
MLQFVHLYVFPGFADWEPAFATAGIQSPQYQREPGRFEVRTVATGSGIVRSMGGLALLPDLALSQLKDADSALLILPGGDGWEDPERHAEALDRAGEFLDRGIPVAAICGATAGLARRGWLDARAHTSNAPAYLNGTGYAGAAHYRDEPAVSEGGLITAGGMAPVEFAREIFSQLELYEPAALEAWFNLFKTGKSEYFARLQRAAETPVPG